MKLVWNLSAAAGALVISACASAGQDQIGVSDLERQRVAGTSDIRAPGGDGFSPVSVLVTVGKHGRVVQAKVVDDRRGVDHKPVLDAARAWRFRPQFFEGRAVEAIGVLPVYVLPPEQPADASASFPSGTVAETEVVLERGACFGSCPDYRVSVRGDGLVRFSTGDRDFAGDAAEVHRRFNGSGVLLSGTHDAHIDPADAAALIGRFRAAHFMGLKAEYRASVTDLPTQALTVRVGTISKRVEDYAGPSVGMPSDVTRLEQAVDQVAQSARWVDGDKDTIAWLTDQHFDFHSAAAAELAAAVVETGRDNPHAAQLLLGLIERGLPLDVRRKSRGRARPLGSLLVSWAARAGEQRLFDRLDAQGMLRNASSDDLQQAFAAGAGCVPSIARALVAAGASPKATKGGSPLIAIRESYGLCQNKGDTALVAMAATLIELGVPLEARDPTIGWTALMGCDSPELARLLLARGANVNARDKDGTSALLGTDDDRVALLLLRAGADPRARDENGSVRDQAIKQHMPATLAWLDEHANH